MWLRGTWFLMDGQLVRWMQVDGGRIAGTSADGAVLTGRYNEVDTIWPRTGAINLPDVGALYVQRSPAKQYRRSYSPRDVRTKVPGRWVMQRAYPNSSLHYLDGDCPEVVRALTEPWYPYRLDEAVMLLNKVPTVALNRQLILLKATATETLVYYKGAMCGRLDDQLEFLPDADDFSMKRVTTMLGGMV